MRLRRQIRQASSLLITLGALAILSIAAAYTLRRVAPRFQMTSQASAWQEARLAAESGIDLALNDLTNNAVGTQLGTWKGWQQRNANGQIVPAVANTLNTVDGAVGNVLSGTLGTLGNTLGNTVNGTVNGVLSLLGSQVQISEPIFLDNLQGVAPTSRPTNVDVQLWAVYPTSSPYYRWFRLRAMATCALPPTATRTYDAFEGPLRRFSLHNVRPQLQKDDVGTPMSIPTPNTSRVIEVLAEPVLPFELAILTDQSLSLGTSGSWTVDSFDSRDPNKSAAGGAYPGSSSPLVQSNGNIGNNAGRPANSVYGPLLAANGCVVHGGVATNGGDNPATNTHENVSGATGVDASLIHDDFYREMPMLNRPTTGIFMPPPLLGLPYTAQDQSQPAQYLVPGNLGAFTVAPYTGQNGALIIMVNGDFDVPSGTISIPANVTVQIYVRGNVNFHDNAINQGGHAGQLQIYGEETNGAQRTLVAYGSGNVTAAFYAPEYDAQLSDAVTWTGAIAARTFTMLGGGTGGFHYDEALGVVGVPIGYRIARYVEDVRE